MLGGGRKCYATRLFNAKYGENEIVEQLLLVAKSLASDGIKVVRRKVEVVIFDDRSSKVNCDGGCIDCHIDDLVES